MHWYRRLTWTVAAAFAVFVPGCIGGAIAARLIGYPERPGMTVPLPHHIPKSPDAVTFRFAMAHDVIHERYPKHGPAFYRERERLARAKLATIPADSDEAFALTDDIGTGLDRLGKPGDAVPLMRQKLELQVRRSVSGRERYTTYANLGTFLVHANMKAAMGGDATAKEAVKEGLTLVDRSIEVNPNAHFGREEWQLVIGRFLLEACDKPDLLTTRDCIGDRLDHEYPESAFQPASAYQRDELRLRPYLTEGLTGGVEQISHDRRFIARVGLKSKINERDVWKAGGTPFDEPMLGIIGMWRQGGGANPHFALCIGEVMLRVGQRHIAWSAFERANRLADRYWADPAKQQFLRDHCGRRQKLIEDTLPAAEVAELRPRFEAELAYGERYQREYQEYEATKIAAGADIHDEHLFDDFHRGREPIATTPGPEEWLVTQREPWDWLFLISLSSGAFTSGLTALLVARWLRRRAARAA